MFCFLLRAETRERNVREKYDDAGDQKRSQPSVDPVWPPAMLAEVND